MAPCLCLVHKEHAIVQMDSYWLLLRRPTLLLGFIVDEASLGLIFSSSTLDSLCELNNRHYDNAHARLLSANGTVAPWLYLSPQYPVTQSHPTSKNKEIFYYYLICR
jgi:hypothetical protein